MICIVRTLGVPVTLPLGNSVPKTSRRDVPGRRSAETVEVRVSEPGTGRWLVGPSGGELRYEDEVEAEKKAAEQASEKEPEPDE